MHIQIGLGSPKTKTRNLIRIAKIVRRRMIIKTQNNERNDRNGKNTKQHVKQEPGIAHCKPIPEEAYMFPSGG
ncbi:MAG: hypothetical protein COX61_00120 [Candidatus Brennerbacteria bacterium CG_4_10_14_0_2_um_filter_43_14]|nr:MAG: hypothetical protein COX61_00120 [Candidatus Brennerbacteria bacterium CG_4_10_14_0_2_um_filter_43_14]